MTAHPVPPDEAFAQGQILQEQFLKVLPLDEAVSRFRAVLPPGPLGAEKTALADAVGRVLADDVQASVDVPPFDRALVDGFAVRAADLGQAGEANAVELRLNGEVLGCGAQPRLALAPGTATPIATGAPLPRGADAVVMIEWTEPAGPSAVAVRRSAAPGAFVGFAGSDIVAGETVLRRGTLVGAREVGVLAAAGIGAVSTWRRPRVGVISTGDELVAPGRPLPPAGIYDSNGPMLAAALREDGCEAVPYGAVRDEPAALTAVIRQAFAECDGIVLSGGTSKGAGDLTYRLVAGLGRPGIVAHGVALKPGKPLLLAVCDGKPVVVLPGFPTSAMFTFHAVVAPELRRLAGLPARQEGRVAATAPNRIASELGRTEFVMVQLAERDGGLAAYPVGKGSGSVTSFSQADGFLTVPALADAVAPGTPGDVTLFAPRLALPDLAVTGSHCIGLDALMSRLAERGVVGRLMAVGSQGGLAAARRGECDLAPIHLLDEASGLYNAPFLTPGLTLVEGWRRMQGILFRRGDERFEGRQPSEAAAAILADPGCSMVNRNAGSGTRILVDRLLAGARPEGYSNQPRSHNAVAAAIVQGRADWGVAIEPLARRHGLGFIPLAAEHYDFALVEGRRERPAVRAFLAALVETETRARIAALGFAPAGTG